MQHLLAWCSQVFINSVKSRGKSHCTVNGCYFHLMEFIGNDSILCNWKRSPLLLGQQKKIFCGIRYMTVTFCSTGFFLAFQKLGGASPTVKGCVGKCCLPLLGFVTPVCFPRSCNPLWQDILCSGHGYLRGRVSSTAVNCLSLPWSAAVEIQ